MKEITDLSVVVTVPIEDYFDHQEIVIVHEDYVVVGFKDYYREMEWKKFKNLDEAKKRIGLVDPSFKEVFYEMPEILVQLQHKNPKIKQLYVAEL